MIFIAVITAAFIIVWAIAQAVQAGKNSDLDKLCAEKTDTWYKELDKLYPASICGRPFPDVATTSCGVKVLTAPLCATSNDLQGCSDADKKAVYNNTEPAQVWKDLARYMEREHKCSGFCGRRCSIYLYSDCNNKDMQDQTCDAILYNIIKKNAADVGGVSGAGALTGCFVIFALIMLCCDKNFGEEDGKEKNKA